MADKVEITAADLETTKKHMFATNKDLQDAIKRLQGAAQSLENAWRSRAGTTVQDVMAQLNAEGNGLQQSLEALGEAVHGSHQAYEQQEEEAKKAVGKVASALKGE